MCDVFACGRACDHLHKTDTRVSSADAEASVGLSAHCASRQAIVAKYRTHHANAQLKPAMCNWQRPLLHSRTRSHVQDGCGDGGDGGGDDSDGGGDDLATAQRRAAALVPWHELEPDIAEK